MPFYAVSDMEENPGGVNPLVRVRKAVGEFMKVGIVTKPEGEGSPLHERPNEEQWTYILEGQMHYILGDEERIVEPGDLVHIPRFTMHRSRPVNGPATFFTVKSPAGKGELAEDYHKSDNAEEAEKSYPGSKG